MNLTMKIVRQNEKHYTLFLKKAEKSEGISRRRKYEYK